MVAKTRQVYPRERQKKLAKNILDNISRTKPLGVGELVASSGYAEIAAKKHPIVYIKSKGTQKALEELGFSEYNAMRIIGEILNQPVDKMQLTPDNQIRAASEVFKVKGSYAPDKLEVKKVIAKINFNFEPKKTDINISPAK